MFSIITMASSTTKPVAMVSAISVRLFRLKPQSHITANVPTSDSGTATAGMMVARRLRRKTKITAMTSTIESSSSICTSSTDARMVVVRSVSSLMSTAGGMVSLQLRQQFFDAVRHFDDIRAGLALHIHHDGRLRVRPRRKAQVFGIIHDFRDIAHT